MALVESRVTIGFLVMICETGVIRGSSDSAATYMIIVSLLLLHP